MTSALLSSARNFAWKFRGEALRDSWARKKKKKKNAALSSFYGREITVDMDGLALETSTKIPTQTLEMNVVDTVMYRGGMERRGETGKELILKRRRRIREGWGM